VALSWTDEVPGWLASEGSSERFGARLVRRRVEQEVENEIGGRILRGEISAARQVTLSVVDDALAFEVHELRTDPLPSDAA